MRINIPRVLVVVAHEGLAAAQDILLRVVQLVRDLNLLAQDDRRPSERLFR